MKLDITDWDTDIPSEPEEEYEALVRTLRFTEGFGLIFVRCTPAKGKELIDDIKKDITSKNIEVLQLNRTTDNVYELVEELDKKTNIDILFIEGLEQSLYSYEESKKLSNWDTRDIYNYSWKGVPPILVNLNQQRERFRDNFKICFVFLLPLFAIKYFIHRAPDFFDWRSAMFEFPSDEETLISESSRVLIEGDYEQYLGLTQEERNKKIIEVKELIAENNLNDNHKASLFLELGVLFAAEQNYQAALYSFDKAVEIKPGKHEAWYNRGIALRQLGRLDEAVASYDKAVQIKPDKHEAWYNRGIALRQLRRLDEAVASYNKAVEIKPDYHEAWYNLGNALGQLGRLDEAIASYDKAIELNPEYANAWYNRACAYGSLNNMDLALRDLQQAINLDAEYSKMIKTDADFDGIRDDARFIALL